MRCDPDEITITVDVDVDDDLSIASMIASGDQSYENLESETIREDPRDPNRRVDL